MDLINTCYEGGHELHALAYYSHLLPLIVSLFIGTLVVMFAHNRDKALLFFSFVLLLCLWLLGDLVAWTTSDYFLVAGFWSYLDFVNVLFYLFIFYFAVFDFTQNSKIRSASILIGTLASVAPFLITMAGVAVYEFNEPNCEMIGNEWLALYKLAFEWTVIASITTLGVIAMARKRTNKHEFWRLLLTTVSTVGFLGIFSSTEFIATSTEVYEINLYALFALPIFILLLAVSIFEMRTFRFKLDSVQVIRALFVVFILVTVSNLFFIDEFNDLVVSATGSVVTLGLGLLVIRGANREAEQRKLNEDLAKNVEKANKRLRALDKQKSEFVSIASHQLRSPLTSIRGYASLLREGSYGKVPKKMKDPIGRIEESSKLMALAIEDYLSVSRIESNNMKYSITNFNLRDQVENVSDDLRSEAVKHGLILLFRTNLNSRGIVNADLGKTVQIVQNLIHNAIKYTLEGTIRVLVRDDLTKKRIYVDVIDTGIGMNEETIDTLFQKFERAKSAGSLNVNGVGLGLFVSLKMSEAMGGTITAHSEGLNRGSRFTLELPLAM